MPLSNPSSCESTPKSTPLLRRAGRPDAIFHRERTLVGQCDRNVTKRAYVKKTKDIESYHSSCPSIVDSVGETPSSFVNSLRNYETTPKKKKVEMSKKCPKSPLPKNECSLVVAVRMRPFSTNELEEPNVASVIDIDDKENTVVIREASVHNESIFQFDYVFSGINDQENVYNNIGKKVLDVALEGYNTCLFAYGQTGSGKTYSIIGTSESPGIIPRFGKDLFERISNNKDVVVELSYCEIYKDKIHDLLSTDSYKKALRVRKHPEEGPFAADLLTFTISSNEDFQSRINMGNKNRSIAANGVNERSSRAHSICMIKIHQSNRNSNTGTYLTSKVNIVDLAGSERASDVKSQGERLKEGVAINMSLLTLGKVITQLAERSSQPSKNCYISYRESLLTWLLKTSLGENSRTFMLATISPCASNVEETANTLRYACQSRNIINFVKINEDTNNAKIKQLLIEIDHLKEQQRELDAWKKEKLKLDHKRELITKYEIEVDELRRLLDEAKHKLDQKSFEIISKKTVDKSQQTNCNSPPNTKSLGINTSQGCSCSSMNNNKHLEEAETENESLWSDNQRSSEAGSRFTFTSEGSTVIQSSQSLQNLPFVNETEGEESPKTPENRSTDETYDVTVGKDSYSESEKESPIVNGKTENYLGDNQNSSEAIGTEVDSSYTSACDGVTVENPQAFQNMQKGNEKEGETTPKISVNERESVTEVDIGSESAKQSPKSPKSGWSIVNTNETKSKTSKKSKKNRKSNAASIENKDAEVEDSWGSTKKTKESGGVYKIETASLSSSNQVSDKVTSTKVDSSVTSPSGFFTPQSSEGSQKSPNEAESIGSQSKTKLTTSKKSRKNKKSSAAVNKVPVDDVCDSTKETQNLWPGSDAGSLWNGNKYSTEVTATEVDSSFMFKFESPTVQSAQSWQNLQNINKNEEEVSPQMIENKSTDEVLDDAVRDGKDSSPESVKQSPDVRHENVTEDLWDDESVVKQSTTSENIDVEVKSKFTAQFSSDMQSSPIWQNVDVSGKTSKKKNKKSNIVTKDTEFEDRWSSPKEKPNIQYWESLRLPPRKINLFTNDELKKQKSDFLQRILKIFSHLFDETVDEEMNYEEFKI